MVEAIAQQRDKFLPEQCARAHNTCVSIEHRTVPQRVLPSRSHHPRMGACLPHLPSTPHLSPSATGQATELRRSTTARACPSSPAFRTLRWRTRSARRRERWAWLVALLAACLRVLTRELCALDAVFFHLLTPKSIILYKKQLSLPWQSTHL